MIIWQNSVLVFMRGFLYTKRDRCYATIPLRVSFLILVQDLNASEIHADHFFLLGADADDEIRSVDF